MKLLLDTHILLWWLSDNDQLSLKARELISNPENDIFVSHVSLWEIQIKVMTGKIQVDLSRLIAQLSQNNFIQLTSHTDHILQLAKLPPYHQDPFDRMLIAQALSEPLKLVTHDKYVSMYSESIILV